MMTDEEKLEKFRNEKRVILNELKYHRNRDVMIMLREYTKGSETLKALHERLESMNSRYYYMLRLMTGGGTFDNTAQAMRDFGAELEQLIGDVEHELEVATSTDAYYGSVRFQRLRPEETLETLFADYFEEAARVAMDPAALTNTRCHRRLETLASDIFMHIWTLRNFNRDHVDMLHTMITDANIPLYDRVLWLNALGLGEPSDRLRNECLAALGSHGEKEIGVAARVWVVVNALRSQRYEVVADLFADSKQELGTILLEYARAVWETGRGVNYFPDMASMGRYMPMGSDPEKMMAEMPPELRKKMEDFAKAQLDGADVFAQTLGQVRNMPFFGRLSNWFLPFHLEHSDLAQVVESASVGVVSMLENMLYLCDSDKYALVLNMAAPDARSAEMLAQMYGKFSSIESEMREAGAESGFGDKDEAQVRSNLFKTLTRVIAGHRFDKPEAFPEDYEILRDRMLGAIQAVYGTAGLPSELEFMPRKLDEAGLYEPAAYFYEEISKDCDFGTPEKCAANVKAGDCYAKARMWREAAECYRAAIGNGDESYETLLALARMVVVYGIWIGEGFDLADRLARFADRHSDDREYLELLSRAYCSASRWEEALQTIYNWDYVLLQGCDKAKPYMAKALIHLGELEQAGQVLEAIGPEYRKIRVETEYAIALWLKGRRKEAVDVIEKHIIKDRAYTLSDLDSQIDSLKQHGRIEFGADEDNSLGLLHDAVSFRTMPPL